MSRRTTGSFYQPTPRLVNRSPGLLLQSKCACGGTPGPTGECEACRKKRETATLQRAASHAGVADSVPPIVHDVLHTPGQPLDRTTRSFMEPRFGHDFSQVRIHTDAQAAQSAKAVDAKAYTVGQHMVFDASQYTPGVPSGRQLVAHELAHTIQQRGQTNLDGANLSLGLPDDHYEGEAEHVANLAMGANALSVSNNSHTAMAGLLTNAPSGFIQRQVITPLGQGGGFGGLMERDRRRVKDEPPAELTPAQAIQGGVDHIKELTEGALRGASVAQRLAMLEVLILTTWTGSSEENAILKILRTTPIEQADELKRKLSEQKVGGKSYLKALDDVVDLGNNLELHAVLSELRLKAMGPEKGTTALTSAPVLPWHDVMGFFEDDATFFVSTNPAGQVVVKYPVRVRDAKDFGGEPHRLPLEMFIGGYAYDPNQVLVIHDYDSGKFVPVVAQELIGYQRAGIRGFLGHVTTVASFATPVGAARTALGKTALFILERALPAIFLLIDENRLNLVKWFPNWGPKMIYYADLAKVGMGVYDLGRFAISGYKFFANWKQVRQARAALESGQTVPDAEKVALALEKQADDIFNEVEKLQASEASQGKAAAKASDAASLTQAPARGREVDAAKAPAIQGKPNTTKAPPDARGRLFEKPTITGDPNLKAGEGFTTKFGDVTYSTQGSAKDIALVKAHEMVHSALSPKLKFLRNFRADFGQAAYNKSSFLKYLEEALAETYAQVKVNGIKSLPTGIKFPITNGYVKLSNVVAEGVIGTVTLGGITYGVYVYASSD